MTEPGTEQKLARVKLAYITTESSEQVRVFLRGQLSYMRRCGAEVTVFASPGPELADAAKNEGVDVVAIPMEREISPVADAVALVRLVRALRRLRPDVVISGSPKAGFLGTLAAALARVPSRVYHLRTVRLETTRGAKRAVLEITERLAARCATCVLAISPSLGRRYVGRRFCGADKVTVVGHGSSNGIDTEHFSRSPRNVAEAGAIASRIGLAPGQPVIGFVGRLTRDKGIPELLDAFDICRRDVPDVRLLLVGRFEDGDPVPAATRDRILRDPAILFEEWATDTAPYYLLMRVLALPSHREGFGNVVLEANASEVPVVASRIVGLCDAVDDGVSGALVEMGDVTSFARAILDYLHDPDLSRLHGTRGRDRAIRLFQREQVWEGIADVLARGPRRRQRTSNVLRVQRGEKA